MARETAVRGVEHAGAIAFEEEAVGDQAVDDGCVAVDVGVDAAITPPAPRRR